MFKKLKMFTDATLPISKNLKMLMRDQPVQPRKSQKCWSFQANFHNVNKVVKVNFPNLKKVKNVIFLIKNVNFPKSQKLTFSTSKKLNMLTN